MTDHLTITSKTICMVAESMLDTVASDMSGIVVVVDPFSSGSLYASRLAKRGLTTLAVRSSASVPEHFLRTFVPEAYFDRSLKTSDDLAAIRPLAVIAGAETGVLAADEIAGRLGVRGNPVETSLQRRDKQAMQSALARSGLNHISTLVVKDRSEISSKVAACSFEQWVIKPRNSAASEGVVKGIGAAQLEAALSSANWDGTNDLGEKNTGFLIQPFVAGPEYALDLVAGPNGIGVGGLCRYWKDSLNGGDFVYVSKEVLDPSDSRYAEIVSYGMSSLKALDCRFGPMHLEIIDASNGPVLVEAGARLHGGIATPGLFDQCYSQGLVEMSIEAYLDNAQPVHVTRRKAGRIVYLLSNGHGHFAGLSAPQLSYLAKARSYQEVTLYRRVGEPIGPTVNLASCVGVVTFCSDETALVEDEAAGFMAINTVDLN